MCDCHGSDIEARLLNSNLLMVNYCPQKFLGLLAPTQYVSVTRLSESLVPRDYLQTGMLLFPYPAHILERDRVFTDQLKPNHTLT